jgi:NIPSNAP
MSGEAGGGAATPVLDIRTYKLRRGRRGRFDRIFREEALPLLQRVGIDVVCFGPSLVDDDYYLLVRGFASGAERDEQLAAFYGSEAWQRRFSARVEPLIESYHVVVAHQAAFEVAQER